VLLACAPFLLLECGLRVAGKPEIREAVDLDPVVDLHQLKPLFELEGATGRYHIPDSRRNFFQPASFPAEKAAASKRIFVLGGSTVQGRPYAPETAFSTWLQLRLQSADANTDFQVINCGGVSYASYRLARVLDEVLRYQPDAVVLYTGHNEFLEERSYADVRAFGAARSWISRIGSQLHTVRWLRARLLDDRDLRTPLPMEVTAKLDHPGGLADYRRDEDWRRGVEQHFAWTLQRMVAAARAADVPLLLCLPASDLVNTPPLTIELASGLRDSDRETFQTRWQRARDEHFSAQQRIDAARECLAIDPQHAGAHYIAGRLLYAQGNTTAAKQHLQDARDFDVCPLRATGPIVSSVRSIARQYQLPLIDTAALLDQRSSDGKRIPDSIADPEFFIDHVHPTIAGHQVIAAALADEFERLGWVAADTAAQQRYQQLVQAHLATLGEAYYARGRQRLAGLRRWATGRAGELGIDDPATNP
jgi:lysophospholipase L1-like esterase